MISDGVKSLLSSSTFSSDSVHVCLTVCVHHVATRQSDSWGVKC